MENNIEVLKKSGLRSKGELDVLLNVSYPMVYKYLQGAQPRTPERRSLFAAIVKVLSALTEQGKLPFPEDKDADARLKAVEKIRTFVQSKLQH
jgi:hypothetical protein